MNIEPRCKGLVHIMYGDELDLRDEEGKEQREALAKSICSECELQLACIEFALLNNEELGVWGNFTPGERRVFKRWLNQNGYRGALPSGKELLATIEFYRGAQVTVKRRK